MIAKSILICGLAFLFYQDMRYRAVYWLSFPALLLVLVWALSPHLSLNILARNIINNLLMLLVQITLVSLYFSIKKRKWVNITRSYLGLGDILFLVCIAVYLSPLNYLAFYLASLMFILAASLVLLTKYRPDEMKIPLAGLQAILFAALLITDWSSNMVDLTSDDWLINYMRL